MDVASQALSHVKLHSNTQVKTFSDPKQRIMGAAQPKGMGGGKGVINVNSAVKPKQLNELTSVVRHEREHLAPKRNTANLKTRLKDPTRLGREEARADHLSGAPMDYRTSDPAYGAGYREVRQKMAASNTRTRVNKMSPDPSALHAVGTAQVRRIRRNPVAQRPIKMKMKG